MRNAKLRKKEQQDERKKWKEEKRAVRKMEAEQKKREQAKKEWERAEEEDRRKRTNPRKYVSFVNISFDVPHPKEQKPLMVWREQVRKILCIMIEDGNNRAALTTYATTDYTMMVKDPKKMPAKMTELQKLFKTVRNYKERGKCYTNFKLLHNKPFEDIKQNCKWELDNAVNGKMYLKRLQVPETVLIGWIAGLSEHIDQKDWEEWFNKKIPSEYQTVQKEAMGADTIAIAIKI